MPILEQTESAEIAEQEPEEFQGTPSLDDEPDLRKKVISKIIQHNSKGKSNRMEEVQNARDQRLYFRGIQYFVWNEDEQNVDFYDDDDEPYSRVFNIIQGYGKIFIATFMGATPKCRAEADDPFDPISIRNTSKAQTYERVYNKFNDMPSMQMEFARLIWTDSRVLTRTTTSETGKEITEFYGTLESRLNISAPVDTERPLKWQVLVEIENEYPLVTLKREYGDKTDEDGTSLRKRLSSGLGDSYERNSRIAVKRQAGTDTSFDTVTGDDASGLGTKTWSYMRPDFYENFEEADRVRLEELFPDGFCLVRSGDLYLDSYPENMDARLDVIFPLPGDGSSRPSIGDSTMPLQDSVNTAQNLVEEILDHGVPTDYYDMRTDIDGLNKNHNSPGQSRKATGVAGEPLSNMFYRADAVNPPQQLFAYLAEIRGTQAQFANGQQGAIYGAELEGNHTASAYAQAKNMALGQMAIVWKPFTAWNAREKTRAVKLASQRSDAIATTLPPARKGAKPEAVKIAPQDLVGLSFTNASDENFPETWTERSNKIMQLLQIGGDLADILLDEEPDNLYLLKEAIGLPDLVVPGEDLRNNVLEDIAAMKDMAPEPVVAQMPQQMFPAMGQPPAQLPVESPIQIDADFMEDKDFEIGFRTVKHWMMTAGRDAKRENPMWFENVRLYGMQYKERFDAIQQAKQPQPEPPKGPSVSVAYADLPASGKVQAAAEAGIQITPEDVNGQTLQDAATKTASTGVQ